MSIRAQSEFLFRCYSDPDTTTAQGRLVFHMFGALAEFERSLIRERTQAGLAAARRAGRTGGRPPKLTDEDIEAAKAMLANPDISVTSDRAPPRRLAGNALSIYARRADREYPRRLRTAALFQRRDAPGRFQPGGGRRQCADSGHSRDPNKTTRSIQTGHSLSGVANGRLSPITGKFRLLDNSVEARTIQV
jgi:resolvase-like protein